MDFCFLFPFLLSIGSALLGTALGWMWRQRKVLSLNEELELHQQKQQTLSGHLQSTTVEYEGLQQKYLELDQSFGERQLAFEDLERNHKSMHLAFDQTKTEMETHRLEASTRLSGLENDVNHKQTECLEQQAKIMDLETTLETLHQSKIQLTSDKENLSNVLADAQAQLKHTQAQYENAIANHNQIKQQAETIKVDLQKSQQDLNHERTIVLGLKKQLQKANAQWDQAKKKTLEQEKLIRMNQSALEKANKQLAQSKKELNHNKTSLENTQQLASKLETQAAQLQSEIGRLNGLYESKEELWKEAKVKIKEQEKQVLKLGKKNEETLSQMGLLENEKGALRLTVVDLESNLSKSEAKQLEANQKLAESQGQLKKLASLNGEQVLELTNLKAAVDNWNEKYDARTSTLAICQTDLKNIANENKALQTQLTELEEFNITLVATWEKKYVGLKKQYDAINAQLEVSKSEKNGLTERLNSLALKKNQEAIDWASKYKTIDADFEKTKHQLAAATVEKSKLEKGIQQLTLQQTALKKWERLASELQQQLTERSTHFIQLEAEKSALETELNQVASAQSRSEEKWKKERSKNQLDSKKISTELLLVSKEKESLTQQLVSIDEQQKGVIANLETKAKTLKQTQEAGAMLLEQEKVKHLAVQTEMKKLVSEAEEKKQLWLEKWNDLTAKYEGMESKLKKEEEERTKLLTKISHQESLLLRGNDSEREVGLLRNSLANWRRKYEEMNTAYQKMSLVARAEVVVEDNLSTPLETLEQLELMEQLKEDNYRLATNLKRQEMERKSIANNNEGLISRYENILFKQIENATLIERLEAENKKIKAQFKNQTIKVAPKEKATPQTKSTLKIKSVAKKQATELKKKNHSVDPKKANLQRIKSKAKLIDFKRIGKATAKQKDDLKKISGIGAFIEEKLNALGIYRFEQISKFNRKDVEMVNQVIEFFPGRIKRDQWVRQAKGLMTN